MDQRGRLLWADATRGVGILAVVLFHVLIWHHDRDFGEATGAAIIWGPIDSLLGSARMPVLLAVAGIFAARGLLGGWRTRKTQARFVSNYYLYVVWLVIYFAVDAALRFPDFPHVVPSLEDFALQLIVPGTSLWFLMALGAYAVVVGAAVALRAPVWVMLSTGVVLWGVGTFVEMPEMASKMPANLIFFMVGVYFADRLRSVAEQSVRVRLAWAIPFVVASVVKLAPVTGAADATAGLVASLASVPAAIALVSIACAWEPFARAARYLGSRTLVIYVLHPIVIMLWATLLDVAPWSSVMRNPILDLAYPVLLTGAVVVACLAVQRALSLIPSDPLFVPPRRLVPSTQENPTRR
ncbi:acyltransferase [Pseudoclavibacter sp. RFBA6]|uniref:acyltransferase family protein n=1 Tax=Pseudoclavibacter sp. RFBA6 TaxID=2080573 RepID=UPI000CE903D1|nr:acyltransferase [Pseudoclavibacter sp. RFBA6]PPG39433.1 hypothetical protein C5C17_11605 [Pseudoclavibacter sp. RFBA6]